MTSILVQNHQTDTTNVTTQVFFLPHNFFKLTFMAFISNLLHNVNYFQEMKVSVAILFHSSTVKWWRLLKFTPKGWTNRGLPIKHNRYHVCWWPGGRFKNTYELLNLRALKFSYVNKIHIFQCMGKIFCVEFQRYPLKFHTKHLTHTLKDIIFMQFWNFKSS